MNNQSTPMSGQAITIFAAFALSLALRAEPATPQPVNADWPSVQALLDRYAESQKVFRSFILTFEETSHTSRIWNGVPRETDHAESVEIRYDGRRAKLIRKQWGYVDPALSNLPKEKAQSQFWMWDGKTSHSFAPNYLPGHPPKLELTQGLSMPQARSQLQFMYERNFIPYVNRHIPCDLRHDTDTIDQALRRAKRISLRPEREKVGNSLCYVIEAELEAVKHSQLVDKSLGGTSREDESWVAAAKHTLWLDPDHDYHLAKAVSVYAKPLDGKTFVYRTTRENVRFARMDGVWLPVEMDMSATETGTANPGKVAAHYKVTSFVRNPDHEACGSFWPGEVADGALVIMFEKGKQIRRSRWQDGQVIP